MPALLTKISMEPNCWTVSSTSRAQTVASPPSPTSAADLTQRASSFCCGAVGAELEPCTATLAPASAKATAMAAPDPRDEPVIRADFPLRLNRSRIRSKSFPAWAARKFYLSLLSASKTGLGGDDREIDREARSIRRAESPPRCTILQRTSPASCLRRSPRAKYGSKAYHARGQETQTNPKTNTPGINANRSANFLLPHHRRRFRRLAKESALLRQNHIEARGYVSTDRRGGCGNNLCDCEQLP